MSGPILIFDSGVGGLSVAHALRQHYPSAALCYACDNAWLPYGLRDDTTLAERIVTVCQAAVTACQASVLVVACNTASTLALEGLRQALSIPVIGTVPAIKPAAQLSATRHIGLLATTATVNRPYTQGLIDSFASDCRVTKIAADALVTEAEAWLAGVPLDMSRVQQALTPLWQATKAHPALDTVVLGCTHFPLLQPQLVTLAPVPITWVDSGDAIARRVGQVATTLVSSAHDGRCYTTAPATALTDGFARYGFQPPRLLALPDAREAVDQ
ncbi:glutamate racemase [Halomonas sp. CnH100-B]|uniref:glutamate racemase n=1 Tax=Halomonas sp. CnH100-B TaxID=2954490 RepID=UPI000C586383|nr:glutamate racemase [Halomonas sp. CnH100-B]MAO62123.1 glutamate racemase [Halomonas sp.]MCO7228697.1 glutamate racemase [Halomonas sp. CnH100-B]HBM27941.1 glutamate racemase [Halomonas sp.]|tara:strand:- start:475 stop:1287 length:813 start_codon:yes stop_codon:yes gene_type:complete